MKRVTEMWCFGLPCSRVIRRMGLMIRCGSCSVRCKPNCYTLSTVIIALANQCKIVVGMQIHALVVKHSFEVKGRVCIPLITMLSKSGMIRDMPLVYSP